MPSDAVLYQAAALCLTYPGDDFRARIPLLREAAPQLREFVDHAALTPAPDLAAHYVRVFDAAHDRSLYLSRRPGMSPPPSEDIYRSHGLKLTGEQPPDYLPAILEFTSRTSTTALLLTHQDAVNALHTRLTEVGTPYAAVLRAVCATLPTPG
ncbi:nitrate reductase molybdenum cofactor assembly chaperone [Streptomyces sp. NPDC059477]|uniref:nitrate reductase molybdenum cofactor assembly chaperone n=1 Tax=Streptomyces sp. NPDC059477 TaxID=3346847 RepID=UPI0036B3B9D3